MLSPFYKKKKKLRHSEVNLASGHTARRYPSGDSSPGEASSRVYVIESFAVLPSMCFKKFSQVHEHLLHQRLLPVTQWNRLRGFRT